MNIYLEFCDKQKDTPFIEVRLTDMKPKRRYPHPSGKDVSDMWEGTLVCRVVTSRGSNSDRQNELTGWIRTNALRAMSLEMAYHQVENIQPGGTPRGTDPELNLDWSEVQMPITLSIKKTAWDANIPLQQAYAIEEAFEPEFVKLMESPA